MHDTDPISTWRPILSGNLRDRALEAVRAIGADLRERHRNGSKGASGESTSAASASLGSGDAGIAIFFTYLDRALPGEGYDEDAHLLLERSTAALAEQSLPRSLYSGFCGIAWALSHLQNLGVPAAQELDLEELDDTVEQIVAASPWHDDYDLISGLVGYAVYALERLPDPAGVRVARSIVRRLDELAERSGVGATWLTPPHLLPTHSRTLYPAGWYNLGVAHGVPGIVAILAQTNAAGVDTSVGPELLRGAIKWMVDQRLPDGSDSTFPYCVAPGKQPGPSRAAWCYGDPGVGATMLLCGIASHEPEWADFGLSLLVDVNRRPPETAGVIDASFCHGAAGLAHIFNRAAQATGHGELLAAACRWYDRTLAWRGHGGGIGGFAYRTFDAGERKWTSEAGLLEGSAGIGLALLAAVVDFEPDWDRMFLTNIGPHTKR